MAAIALRDVTRRPKRRRRNTVQVKLTEHDLDLLRTGLAATYAEASDTVQDELIQLDSHLAGLEARLSRHWD